MVKVLKKSKKITVKREVESSADETPVVEKPVKKTVKKTPKKEKMEVTEPATESPVAVVKEKKKTEKRKIEVTEGGYKTGALGSLFGSTSNDIGTLEGPEVFVGETTIKKRKKEKKVKNTEKSEEADDSAAATPEKDGKTKEAASPAGGKKLDRTKERENRKKNKGGMTVDEKKVTLFVGNMPLTMNEKIVKKMFSEYGPVDSVRMRCVIPPKESLTKRISHVTRVFHEKQSSLNFYVKFKEEGSVAKALVLNGTELEGHHIRVDTVEGRRDYDKNTTIYVGNLPFDTTEDGLSAFFEESVGPVAFSRCTKDPKTGMGKGFAFVGFKEASSVDLALRMGNPKFQKRDLRITKVLKKNQVAKVREAVKKSKKTSADPASAQPTKVDKFKFSTKKDRSEDQNNRRALKKSAKKAIHKKHAKKQSKSLMK